MEQLYLFETLETLKVKTKCKSCILIVCLILRCCRRAHEDCKERTERKSINKWLAEHFPFYLGRDQVIKSYLIYGSTRLNIAYDYDYGHSGLVLIDAVESRMYNTNEVYY